MTAKGFSINSLSKIINKLMRECRISINQLHANTGVPLTTIKRMKSDPEANPTISSLVPIADFFGITVNQLIGIDPLPSDRIIGSYHEKRDNWTQVPIISWELAINWLEETIDTKNLPTVSTDVKVSKQGYALIVDEDNWIGFLKGTQLIIDITIQPEHGDYVVTHKLGEKISSFKQLLIHEGVHYLKPLNPDYKTTSLDNSYKILGVLVQTRMNIKG